MHLGGKWVSTAPHKPKLHWSAMYLPIDPPLKVKADETLLLKLNRPLRGSWSWQVSYDGQSRNHSTFKSNLNLRAQLQSNKKNAVPALSQPGQILRDILSCFDGKQSIEAISKKISERWSDSLTPNQAQAMVKKLYRQHCVDSGMPQKR